MSRCVQDQIYKVFFHTYWKEKKKEKKGGGGEEKAGNKEGDERIIEERGLKK